MTAHPTSSQVYFSGGDYSSNMAVSKTTNFESTWTRYNIATGTGRTYSIVVDPNNTNIVYAGGDETSSSAIYKSTNGGVNWSKCTATGLGGACVNSLAIDPDDSNIIYAGTSTNCYKSTNGGSTFSTTSCPGGQTNAVLVNRGSAIYEGIYVGTEASGVYYSTNDGSSWTQINDGLSDLQVNCLSLSENMYVFAGTQGGGIHRWSIAIGSEELTPDNSFESLLSAMPNPIRDHAVLHYALTHDTRVKICIFDVQGRLLSTLIDEVQPAGNHELTWDACTMNGIRMSSGVYFCKLTTDTHTITHKLILMK